MTRWWITAALVIAVTGDAQAGEFGFIDGNKLYQWGLANEVIERGDASGI